MPVRAPQPRYSLIVCKREGADEDRLEEDMCADDGEEGKWGDVLVGVYSGLCGDDTEDGNKASAHRAWVSEVP